MDINSIKTASPFKDLFPVEEELVKKIYWDMQKNGFDESKPIVLWREKSIIIDGHTRLLAAIKAELQEVPVIMKDFKNEEDALSYAINSQKNRRNLGDNEILRCVAALDKKQDKNANLRQGRSETQHCASGKKSSEETAKTLGISPRKVEQVRTVLYKASEETKDAVKSGKMSINAAYNKTVKTKKGTSKSLELAAEELEKIDKVFDIIKERLTKEQIKELIKRLKKDL